MNNIKVLSPEKMETLLDAISKKKELRQLDSSIIIQELQKYLQQETKVRKELEENFHEKAAVFRKTIKEVRSRLRRSYGLFQQQGKKINKKELVKKLFHVSPPVAKSIITEILESHASTQERLSIYRDLYHKIFAVTGKPTTVLDLGCGLNPFSLLFMRFSEGKYYAYDIGKEDMQLLNEFFTWWEHEHHQFHGKAAIFDLTGNNLNTLPPADVCFLFKITDILDKGKGHLATEKAILSIPARFIVLSFATVTMSGKPMTAPQRRWVELLCNRLGFFFSVITFPTEIFYVVRKKVMVGMLK